MALCNCSTPHPWLHDFLLRSPSFAATLSFSLVLSPATRSFSLCIRVYIYILHPFFPSFLLYLVSSTSRYLPWTPLMVSVSGVSISHSPRFASKPHAYFYLPLYSDRSYFSTFLSLSPYLSLSLLLFFNETNEERTPTLTANRREDAPTCIVCECTLEECSSE